MKTQRKSILLLAALASYTHAEEPLGDLDLDALMSMDVQVTSAMKRAQSAFDTASSIYVLTKKQIRQSGATSVPEALKMVPGLIVRQLDNNQWAITARGVASRFSSKLLVMIDGQSLYTPKFSAIYWETLNIPLYDIERIEVIRGHGGLLWGNNASNGVINIITKNSIDSRGTYADITAGDKIAYSANLRYGDDIGQTGSYTVYGHSKKLNKSDEGIRLPAADKKRQHSVGTRLDFTPSDEWSGLVQANIIRSELGQNYRGVIDDSNRNMNLKGHIERTDVRVMTRIENRISPTANQMLQASWLNQTSEQPFIQEDFSSFDIDYQMNFIYHSLQFDWGLNYRYNSVEYEDQSFVRNDNDEFANIHQYGALAQAQLDVIPEKLDLIVGIKSERNALTGWEHQPLARVIWKPQSDQAIWASVSQSVRVPSLIEFNDDYAVGGQKVSEVFPTPTGIPQIDDYYIKTYLNGNDGVKAETSHSIELGYRLSKDSWAIDASLYQTKAKNVVAIRIDANLPQFAPAFALLQAGQFDLAAQALTQTVINFDLVSEAELLTKGGDFIVSWRPNSVLNAEIGYSYNKYEYDFPPERFPVFGFNSITRQIFANVGLQLFDDHHLSIIARHEEGEAYTTDNFAPVDITWNWQVNPNWTVSIMGKNLFAGSHLEYNNLIETYTLPHYIDESFALKLTAEF